MRYLCFMSNFAQNNMGKTNISLFPHGGGISAIPQARRRVLHVWGLRIKPAMRD
jgi:hypothetical protein